MYDSIVLEPLFSTPLGIYHLSDFENTYIDVDNPEEGKWVKNQKQPNVINHISPNVLLEPGFEDLKRYVDTSVANFIYEVLRFPRTCYPELVCSWVTIGLPGSKTNSHFHNNAMYSGVLYLKSMEGSGKLRFSIPANIPTYCSSTIRPVPVDFNLFNGTEWEMQPVTGDVVVFPSHLMHSVDENTTGENRAALAFNYIVKGQISDNTTSALTL